MGEEEIQNKIQECIMCRDFDDTWDLDCFCPKCKNVLLGVKNE